MASSAHIETSTASADIHNHRVFTPDYLIDSTESNIYVDFTDKHISELEQQAKDDYKEHSKNNRRMPSNATLIKEMIVNLEEKHTEQDLRDLKKNLETEFGYTVKNVSFHKDEGYIYTAEKNYTMGREQYINKEETPYIAEYDKKSGKFYEWQKEGNEWQKGNEVIDYQKHHNYHAHIMLLNYDFEQHRTVRLAKKDMSRMQTVVAQTLQMERGKCSSTVEAKKLGVEVQESRKRVSIREYKRQKQEQARAVQTEKSIQATESEYKYRDYANKITALEQADTEQKKELHRLNTQVKKHTAERAELDARIAELESKSAVVEYANEKRCTREELESTKSGLFTKKYDAEKVVELLVAESDKVERLNRMQNALNADLLETKQELRELRYDNSDLIEMQKELSEARETILEYKTSNDTLKDDLSDSEQTIATLRAESSDTEVIALQKKVKQLEKVKRQLLDDIQEMAPNSSYVPEAKKEIQALREENKELKANKTSKADVGTRTRDYNDFDKLIADAERVQKQSEESTYTHKRKRE